MKNGKIDTSKLTLLPVPEGLKMRYKHHYKAGPDPLGPVKLIATDAWLEGFNGMPILLRTATCSKKDVANKKLGRHIAHNRCIKAYHKLYT
jgi:hypothetical protein